MTWDTRLPISGEYSLEQALIEHLRLIGYPEASFVYEWKQNNSIYDLAVIDPKTSELLAVFEFIVSSPIVITTTHIREKIEKYRNLQAKVKVQLYIVDATQGQRNFSITQLPSETKDSKHIQFIKVEELPNFENLRGNVLSKARKMSFDAFSIIAKLSALALLILLILDWTKVIVLTVTRLALIGGIIGLSIAPYSKRIKMLGFEYEKDS